MHRLDIVFFFIFDVDENIIQIYNDKNIKFFHKNLINIALKYCRSISQSKRHYLILEVTIFGLESSFPHIFFANSHLVISIDEVKLGKLLNLP